MLASSRLAFAAKGAILWVLLAVAFGCIAALATPDYLTLRLPWLAARAGIAGAIAHVTVTLLKPDPNEFIRTALCVSSLGCFLVLLFIHWVAGTPSFSEPGAVALEMLRTLGIVLPPLAVVCLLVLRMLRRKSAA